MIRTAQQFRGTPAGFTLIELVLALGLVAGIAATLYSSMHIAFNAAKSAQAAVGPSRTAELAIDFLRTDLQNAQPPNTTIGVSTAISTSTYILAGPFEAVQNTVDGKEADDVQFYATTDGPAHADGSGEIKLIELTMYKPQGSDQYCLVRRVTGNLLNTVLPDPDEEVLCRGVTSFTLEYFDGSEWNNQWDSTVEDNTLPAAVRVTLTLDQPSNASQSTRNYVRIIPLPGSMAALDPNVNSGLSGL